MSDFLSKAKSLLPVKQVTVEGIDMDVFVRSLSVKESRRLTAQCLLPGKKANADDAYDTDKLTLLSLGASLVDAEGNRLIAEGDEEQLLDLPQSVFMTLQQAVMAINGMSSGDSSGN